MADHLGPAAGGLEGGRRRAKGASRGSWAESLLVAVVGFGAFRVITEVIGLTAMFRSGLPHELTHNPAAIWQIWERWDVGWLTNIAARGYQAMGHVVDGAQVYDGTAFPPAMPVIMRLGGYVGLSPGVAGWLASALFLVLALAILFVLAAEQTDTGVARWTVALLLAYPFALFLGTAYADSLVLFGSVAAFLAARRGYWWLAGLAIAAALLAKTFFVLLLVPLTLEAIGWDGGLQAWPVRRQVRAVISLWIPPTAGLGIWMLYLYQTFGQPLRFLWAQKGWGRAVGVPLGEMGLIFNRSVNSGVRFIDAIDALALVLLAVMTVYVYRNIKPTYGVFLGTVWVVFAFNTTLISNARHLVLLFPLFIGLAAWTARRPWTRWVVLTVELPLAVLFVARFAMGKWAG